MSLDDLRNLLKPLLCQWYREVQQDFAQDKPPVFSDALLDMLFDRKTIGRAARAASTEDLEEMPGCSAEADKLSQAAHGLRKIVRRAVKEAMAPTYRTDPDTRADAFARVIACAIDHGMLVKAFEAVRQADDVEGRSDLDILLEEGRRRDARDREQRQVPRRAIYPC